VHNIFFAIFAYSDASLPGCEFVNDVENELVRIARCADDGFGSLVVYIFFSCRGHWIVRRIARSQAVQYAGIPEFGRNQPKGFLNSCILAVFTARLGAPTSQQVFGNCLAFLFILAPALDEEARQLHAIDQAHKFPLAEDGCAKFFQFLHLSQHWQAHGVDLKVWHELPPSFVAHTTDFVGPKSRTPLSDSTGILRRPIRISRLAKFE